MNTNLAAAAGVIGATVGSLIMFKTLDVSQMGNGAIAGLVAITAPCAFVDPWAAVVIGVFAGLIVPPLVVAVNKIRIDDPVGALPVHGMAGIWGTLACGLFATEERATALAVGEGGLFYTRRRQPAVGAVLRRRRHDRLHLHRVRPSSSLAIKYTVGLRVSEEEELRGLDISEHGMFGYPERFIDVPGAESEDLPAPHAPAPAGTATATNPATAS